MKNSELVYREILYNAIEKKQYAITQADIAKKLSISLSNVNIAVKNLVNIGAVEVNPRNLKIIDIKKILYFWASARNLNKDVIYATRVNMPVEEIEKSMPDGVVFTAYTGYKLLFNDVPADYSELYVYGNLSLKERFPENKGNPNLFVLKKDKCIEEYGKKATVANTFVDLWNLKEWYAKEFIKAMGAKLNGILE